MPTAHHLAEFNIARMRGPLDGPVMHGFTSRLAEVNAIAERSAGFVWRLQTDEGNATGLADKHFIDLARSTMVGDTASDQACAGAAGVGRFIWAHDFFGWDEPRVRT